MNIGLIIFAIIGSIIGLASTFYIVISMFWILGVKIVGRINHGTTMYDFYHIKTLRRLLYSCGAFYSSSFMRQTASGPAIIFPRKRPEYASYQNIQ